MKYIRTKYGISKLDAQDDRLTNQINVCDGVVYRYNNYNKGEIIEVGTTRGYA